MNNSLVTNSNINYIQFFSQNNNVGSLGATTSHSMNTPAVLPVSTSLVTLTAPPPVTQPQFVSNDSIVRSASTSTVLIPPKIPHSSSTQIGSSQYAQSGAAGVVSKLPAHPVNVNMSISDSLSALMNTSTSVGDQGFGSQQNPINLSDSHPNQQPTVTYVPPKSVSSSPHHGWTASPPAVQTIVPISVAQLHQLQHNNVVQPMQNVSIIQPGGVLISSATQYNNPSPQPHWSPLAAGINTVQQSKNVPPNEMCSAKQDLDSLRIEPIDGRVRARILGLSKARSLLIANYISSDSALLWKLVTAERGAIVATLIEKLGKDAAGLSGFIMANINVLSQDKGGCVALPRVLRHVGVTERRKALEKIRSNPDAATHKYTNFVLQYFVRGWCAENGVGSAGKMLLPSAAEVCSVLIHNEMSDMTTLLKWSTSRYGSRVVDEVIQQATAQDVRVLLSTIFGNEAIVRTLGAHEFGHFNLKTAFQVLLAGQLQDAPDQPALLRHYYNIAVPLLKNCRYSRWVLRSAKEHIPPGEEAGIPLTAIDMTPQSAAPALSANMPCSTATSLMKPLVAISTNTEMMMSSMSQSPQSQYGSGDGGLVPHLPHTAACEEQQHTKQDQNQHERKHQ